MALTRVRILSPNYSSRSGAKVRLIVLHTAEGATTYQSLGNYFKNPSSQVSSHVGIDDTPNTVGEYVDRNAKAWTAANANPVAIQAELCAFASWTLSTWNQHQEMLNNTAKWIAEEAKTFGIPIVKLTPAQAQGSYSGICQHVDLGSWGGNHTDCGTAFPIDQVISMAQGNTIPTPPAPTPPLLEEDMKSVGCTFTMNTNQQQFFSIDDNGNMIHWYFLPGKPWAKESLGGGWDKETQLIAYEYNNTWQVWGNRSNGTKAQMYWSGTKWIIQALP